MMGPTQHRQTFSDERFSHMDEQQAAAFPGIHVSVCGSGPMALWSE